MFTSGATSLSDLYRGGDALKRRIVIIAGCTAILAALLYLAHTTDFMNIVQRIHGR
jgi:hypothetical protein